MDYDLARLGSHEFERMTQALCVAALGAHLEVFGNGPDGGREATTEERIAWDASKDGAANVELWEGYTVVQAKFRIRPEGVASNLEWLRGEIQKELSYWTDSRYRRSRTRKPDNLLIVTNVTLSATSGGGVDTAKREIAALIKRHKISLVHWRLWHYDDLCALLEAHKSVRTAYGGFITTGDVLARMEEWLGRQAPDLSAALTAHAIKGMLAQQYVRLGQAGESNEDKLALDKVAVDLPASWLRVQEVEEGLKVSAVDVMAVDHIIGQADRVGTHSAETNLPAHILIVGGPGQGKSTLAQMVCQCYRLALLKDINLTGEMERLRRRLSDHFGEIGLNLPRYLRWPIRVTLSEYSEYLAQCPGNSLLRYLADRVSAHSAFDISGRDLLEWLRQWPWLLVLDGMDEVASSFSREQVTTGINEFLIDAKQIGADVLIVATTRPQGYTGEFGVEDYQQVHLADLTPESAMTYARRLVETRLYEDADLRQQVEKRLMRATKESETSRLMQTPLQVTIMTLLLERRQRAPHDRYQLFNAYFDIIYAREVNKPGRLGLLLEEYRPDIEAVHESVAYELQVQAESTDSANAVPIASLTRHAIERLQQEGHDTQEATRLANEINKAATHRLVLLVPHGDNGVAFEVRSLQEYLAARALTRGEGPVILERLRPLVPVDYWRNTWLLAAGRIFREREDLRERLISLLLEVDNQGLLSWIVRAGADLAADLLGDDLAAKSPQYRKLLADQALDKLQNLPEGTWWELATTLYKIAEQDTLIRQKLDQKIASSLAAGGGSRAHALLMLERWSNLTGGLSAKARQHYSRYGDRYSPSSAGLLIIKAGRDGDRRLRELREHGLRIQNGPRLSSYLAGHLPNEGDSRSSLNELFAALPNIRLRKVSSDDMYAHIVPSNATCKPRDVLAIPLESISTADAFAELIERIPQEDWHVAIFLRDIARYWYAFRVNTR